jgi:hypothetical protein
VEGGDNIMASVDSRVVEMNFNNRSFESAVATTLSTLQKLKNALTFGHGKNGLDELQASASRFNLGNLSTSVDHVSGKLLALGTIGVTALANITNRAIE